MSRERPVRRTERASIRDVAKLAGVSPITVSRALALPHQVAPATRERVDAAVAAIGYIPNRVAGSLASNRTHMIGAVVATLGNSIAADFIEGMASVVRRCGFQLLLGNSGFSIEEEEALVVEFLSRRADGIYLTGTTHTERCVRLLRESRTPTVELNSLTPDPIDMVIGFSNEKATFAMAEELARLGRRKVAFFGAATRYNERHAQRLRGYQRAVAAFGWDDDPALVAEMPIDLSSPGVRLTALLAQRPDIDALMCATDVQAVGALFECQRRGIAVPRSLAITGFDDMEIAACVNPSLTTIRVPRHEIGRRAADLLLDRIAGRPIASPIVDLGFEIVRRRSTGAEER